MAIGTIIRLLPCVAIGNTYCEVGKRSWWAYKYRTMKD